MLDKLYQVPVKVLNQAVKRNESRFPIRFRFQLSENETNELSSNSANFHAAAVSDGGCSYA
jgi:hypothetical protein